MNNIQIGNSVCVDGEGGPVSGVVKGVERRADESVCGLILKSLQMAAGKMIHFDLRSTKDVVHTRDCGKCRVCVVSQRNGYLN